MLRVFYSIVSGFGVGAAVFGLEALAFEAAFFLPSSNMI